MRLLGAVAFWLSLIGLVPVLLYVAYAAGGGRSGPGADAAFLLTGVAPWVVALALFNVDFQVRLRRGGRP